MSPAGRFFRKTRPHLVRPLSWTWMLSLLSLLLVVVVVEPRIELRIEPRKTDEICSRRFRRGKGGVLGCRADRTHAKPPGPLARTARVVRTMLAPALTNPRAWPRPSQEVCLSSVGKSSLLRSAPASTFLHPSPPPFFRLTSIRESPAALSVISSLAHRRCVSASGECVRGARCWKTDFHA